MKRRRANGLALLENYQASQCVELDAERLLPLQAQISKSGLNAFGSRATIRSAGAVEISKSLVHLTFEEQLVVETIG